VARKGERRGAYRVWVRRPEGRKHSEGLGLWEDNIKIDLKEIGCEGLDWIELAQVRYWWLAVVNKIMNLRFP
jgi:hypothetical protein